MNCESYKAALVESQKESIVLKMIKIGPLLCSYQVRPKCLVSKVSVLCSSCQGGVSELQCNRTAGAVYGEREGQKA